MEAFPHYPPSSSHTMASVLHWVTPLGLTRVVGNHSLRHRMSPEVYRFAISAVLCIWALCRLLASISQCIHLLAARCTGTLCSCGVKSNSVARNTLMCFKMSFSWGDVSLVVDFPRFSGWSLDGCVVAGNRDMGTTILCGFLGYSMLYQRHRSPRGKASLSSKGILILFTYRVR